MADRGSLWFRDQAGQAVACLQLLAASSGEAEDESAVNPVLEVPPEQARDEGEAQLQLLEGLRYEYELSSPGHRLALRGNDAAGVVRASRLQGRQHSGMLVPGLATGLMPLVVEDEAGQALAWAEVEVRSRKLDYRADYRLMMEDISSRCVDLLGDWRGVSQFKAEPDLLGDPQTMGQRFAFVKALLDSQGFRDALHRITSHPHQGRDTELEPRALGRGMRADRRIQAQLSRGGRRNAVPAGHPLARLGTLPEQVLVSRGTATEDTPENRFVKFALEGFRRFLSQMLAAVAPDKEPRLAAEIEALVKQLDLALHSDVLRHVSEPTSLPLGSPVLQRREGYREVLQAWLNFSLAARLVWHGGEDVYGAGQRDVAALYEYWVFFCLLDMVAELFTLDKPAGASLLEPTGDGFGLKLRAGKFLPLSGRSRMHQRELAVELGYNRSFRKQPNRDKSGSWTRDLRPDYTLSLWPAEFTAAEAEAQELMVHVHFDAKYRVEHVRAVLGEQGAGPGSDAEADEALDEERAEQNRERYKRADLLKMHAYRDAIRRTQGAYVLYPGTDNLPLQGFHEVLPGLGAFALRPGAGCEALREFLLKVVAHVCDRASAREQHSYAAYRNYRAEESSPLYQAYPERAGNGGPRHTPPRQTHVLLGWCKSDEHRQWIAERGLYNFRMDAERGSLALSSDVAGAGYLLLHGADGQALPGLFRIKNPSSGPRVFSRQALREHGYPSEPTRDFYLVFEVESAREFAAYRWDYAALSGVPPQVAEGFPCALSLQAVLQIGRKAVESVSGEEFGPSPDA